MRTTPVMMLALACAARAWSAPPPAVEPDLRTLPLEAVLVDMGGAKEKRVRREAARQARTQPAYKSSPARLPEEVIIEGRFTPDSDDTQVALFSDDGCSLWVDGVKVHDAFGRGQHLPNLDQSFRVVPYQWRKGVSYGIRIRYSNIIYIPQLPDIDGLTFFVYNGGGPWPRSRP